MGPASKLGVGGLSRKWAAADVHLRRALSSRRCRWSASSTQRRPATRQRLHRATVQPCLSRRFTNGATEDFSGQIDFVQYGNLASGTGQVLGETFALSGVDTSGRFTGRAIFFNESEATISGQLSEQNRILSVLRFGSPLQFKR
jgi:hypothetical protein